MSDSMILTKLEALQQLLQCQLGSRVLFLRVVQREGQIALQGVANCYYTKLLAQHLALRVLDTTALVNEIEVRCAVPETEPGEPGAE